MSIRDFPWYSSMSEEEIEKRKEEIERNKREFFAEARDGFYISTREGQFLDCNRALVKMLGYESRAEVLSLDLNTELWADSKDRPKFRAIIEKQGYVRDYKGAFLHKSGRLIHVSLSSHVWRDESGNIRGYRGFVVDRTEERQMRDRLQIVETSYRELFENMLDGVFLADERGTVIDCNRSLCEIIGYTQDEFLGMNYYRDLFVDPDVVTDFRRKLTRGGEIKDYELQIVRKDGTVRDVTMSGRAGKYAAGVIVGYQGLMRDITEEKHLRRQLLQSEKVSAMGKMASQLAHELNNPIYGIMNCLELLRDVVPKTHGKAKYLDLAYNECKRTSGLLIKMLKFFKPDEERRRLTDINRLLAETLMFYERQFKNLNIRVTSDLDPKIPRVMAVGSHLKQVFINMIINANTAMPAGGDLAVSSRFDPLERSVLVSICDTGIGIPKIHLDRIFEAFFTTKKEVKGVGLGLSICYGIIKEHHGRIDVESEPGKGTVFTVYLPVDDEKPA